MRITERVAPPRGPRRHFAGRYRLESVLPERHDGVAYEAMDTWTQRPVVVEVMDDELARDRGRAMRFQTEARAALGVEHDHLVRCVETGMVGSVPFSVSERPDGCTLESLIRDHERIDPTEVLRIAVQTGEALLALHDAGIVHQRLSPTVVIVQGGLREPHVKITGLSSTPTDRQTSGVLSFSALPFLAPEQAVGEPVDPRTDVYALGALMHCALTGRPAVQAGGSRSTLAQVAITTAPAPSWYEPSVPESIDHIVTSATRKHRDSRYASMREMNADLRRALNGEWVAGVERRSFPDRLAPESELGQHLFARYRQELR